MHNQNHQPGISQIPGQSPNYGFGHLQPQGPPPQTASTVPTWSPAALLQPNRQGPTPSQPTSAPSSPFYASIPIQTSGNSAQARVNSPLVFQFASASGTPSAGPSSTASTPPSGSEPQSSADACSSAGAFQTTHNFQNRTGNWIERVNNVQQRPSVPQPKRRKTEDGQDARMRGLGVPMPMRSGSGMLGNYFTQSTRDLNASASNTSISSTVDLTGGNDDDTPMVQDPRDEEVCYGMIKAMLNCTQVPSPKPGTRCIYGDGWFPAIKVVLKRTVGDKTNKIQAYDHTRDIIGSVEPACANALSPLLDSQINMRTDCRIQARVKKPGDEPGQETSKAYAMDIILYGRMRFTKNVGGWLSKHNLRLTAPNLVQKGIRVHNPHVIEWRPPPTRIYPTDSQGAVVSSVSKTVEEMRSEIISVFDSLTRSEDLPLADPGPYIVTPLLKHQRQGLFFMTAREELMHNNYNNPKDKMMTTFWQTKLENHEKKYYNVITQQHQMEPPPETRGGILADMMGLGKTLSILSLIASSMDAATQWGNMLPLQPTAPETKPSRHDPAFSQPLLSLTPLIRNAKTTLLVCPLSTVTNWEEQMKQHLLPDSLKYHIYHGPNRIKDPEKLAAFDIVITTYGSVSNELSSRYKGKEGRYPLEEVGWFRIVLDEAHMIREQSTLQFKSIIRLQANRRWAVTGTPVQNRLEDLAALLAFLRLHPFEHRGKFTRHIVEPFKACDPEVVPRLRILVDTVTLRRLKDKIDLPPRRDLVIKLDFDNEERRVYDLFAQSAKEKVQILARSTAGQALGGNTYIHILKAILRLRLLCAHGKDLLTQDDLTSLQGMSAETAIDIDDEDQDKPVLSVQKAHDMFILMQETNNDACLDCGKKLCSNEPSSLESDGQDDVLGFMTPCFHVICRSCIEGYKERAKALLNYNQRFGPCPGCHKPVKFEFVRLQRRDVDAEHEGPNKSQGRGGNKKTFDNYQGPHTKTRALIEELLYHKAASEANPSEPPFKSVVFSGWTSHLDLIELALKATGISFTRLDGSMSRPARTAAMDSFREDPHVHVILVSIMAGGLGLNLTAGNNVYVMEPQYNPAAEAQAIDRVHRLGQKRPVRTVRFIMRDSFEEKMLDLQEKKKKLASLSMDGQSKPLDKAEAAAEKLKDLRSLFK